MSNYCFFASDKEMPEFDNMKAKPINVDGEVVAINFANGFDEETAMRIVKEDDFCCAQKFTDKKYVNYLEWYYNDDNAQLIVDYIKTLLLVHRIIINWLYLDLILHQQPALLLDLFHQAYMSSDKQQVPC